MAATRSGRARLALWSLSPLMLSSIFIRVLSGGTLFYPHLNFTLLAIVSRPPIVNTINHSNRTAEQTNHSLLHTVHAGLTFFLTVVVCFTFGGGTYLPWDTFRRGVKVTNPDFEDFYYINFRKNDE